MSTPGRPPETAQQRRARLDRIFGDSLPDTTHEQLSESGGSGGRDEDLRRDVPPHHG